jgi:hypothetical protein
MYFTWPSFVMADKMVISSTYFYLESLMEFQLFFGQVEKRTSSNRGS